MEDRPRRQDEITNEYDLNRRPTEEKTGEKWKVFIDFIGGLRDQTHAYLDDGTIQEDESGASNETPTQFPSHARRPKPSQKGPTKVLDKDTWRSIPPEAN
ncbi:hypothetical protein E2562_030576 [Oryza meyeriana var. granulata]|uniref:Uncharacterized protein n=1 Tax=Oryza meyeriana var. granulata TaxID=110450 RepID=A0A6G1BP26_9ORYZ|nr:hypothetical protein E2562_030576 [Oryza meyeriana var. granulata]